MDKHILHNIIHADYGNTSNNCPVCLGKIKMEDSDDMMGEANKILSRRQSRGMMYSEDEKILVAFNEKKDKEADKDKDKDKENTLRPMIDVMSFSESKKDVPNMIKLIPIGKYNMRRYGEVDITKKVVQDMIKHFNDGIRAGGKEAGLPIDIEHGQTQYKDAAAGWIKDIVLKEDGGYGKIEWTPLGQKLLKERIYKFYSPEFFFDYVDPQHSFSLKNVMTGGGLVNKPMIKDDLPAIVNSEEGKKEDLTKDENIHTIYIELTNNLQNMKLSEILLKPKNERTSDEQKFLSEHKDELTLAEARNEGFIPAESKVALQEGQVVVSKEQLDNLTKLAEIGAEAGEKLKKADLKKEIESLVFSEKGTKMATDQIDVAVDLAMSMSEENRKKYFEQLKALPEKQIFKEEGNEKEVATGAAATKDLEEKIKVIMSERKVDYADAALIAVAENPTQFQEYKDNLPVAQQER